MMLCDPFIDRHLRGEELQGLNLEELKHLEKLLEAGLSRVTETKVFEVPSPPTHPSSSLTKFYFRPQFVDVILSCCRFCSLSN